MMIPTYLGCSWQWDAGENKKMLKYYHVLGLLKEANYQVKAQLIYEQIPPIHLRASQNYPDISVL